MSLKKERLQALRQQMIQHGVDYYWVPSADCHFNEYVPDCWERRAWVSGFTGSAGVALVGLEHAWLWTDSRYFLQAYAELEADSWSLMKQGEDLSLLAWLAENAVNRVVGIDPWLMSLSLWQQWQLLAERTDVRLQLLPDNLVDRVWADQPPVSSSSVDAWSERYAGMTVQEKLENVRVKMASVGVDAHVITALDAVAWLTNCRGHDIDCNPVFVSYLVILHEKAWLYVNEEKMPLDVEKTLLKQGIAVLPYQQLADDLSALSGVVWLEPSSTSVAVSEALPQAQLHLAPSPVTLAKAVKNPIEQQGMHEAHRRDGVALVRFLCWLQNHWRGLNEVTLADKLLEFRQQDPHFKQMSFPTISGYADHGAIVHYSAQEATAHDIGDTALLLLDSGGQYDQGTTDVTRTLHLGEPTEGERHHYTLVLKGHLALRHLEFPLGTCGEHLDAIARAPLWAEHLNYGHGTGHGVGCFLNVHEGPQRIAPSPSGVALLPGMVVSNEPGVYFSGQYGIRIENLVRVEYRSAVDDSATGHGPFLGFVDLTVVPYARALIDKRLLSRLEIKQVDRYHELVFELLSDDLNEQERQWLKQATLPL